MESREHHAAALRRLADMLETGRDPDETLAYLLLLAKAMVREAKSKK